MTIAETATALRDDLVRLRHDLHGEPEVGLDLPRTQERVLAVLDPLPLEVSTGTSLTSVIAVLRGGRPGGTVLLRGDMDALPVTEQTGLDFASRVEGSMHACGHDLHTTMLVGAAQLLCDRKDELAGDVIFMFQPGEESGFNGAGKMLSEGLLEVGGRPPDAAYALHVLSAMLPHGVFGLRSGPILAASDALLVTVKGVGGHGSAPHLAKDPVPPACEMVTGLLNLARRLFDPFDPVVLTVGSFHAGTRHNVIPDTAHLEATVRTFSSESRAKLRDASVNLVRSVATAHGLEVDVDYVDEYPMTVTDELETALAEEALSEVFGPERVRRFTNPLTASEDFSRVLDRVPGSFVGLGACPPGAEPSNMAYNHSPRAIFDDATLVDGAVLYAELAARRLAARASSDEDAS